MKLFNLNKITYLAEVDSTNSFAMRNLLELADREIIVADIQTGGKGRFNRQWISHIHDNVYMTVVLKPSDIIDCNLPLANLTQYMSLALSKTLDSYGVDSKIKWPNDVLVNKKKIAGILSQLSLQGTRLKGVIIGVGVNLNLTENDINSINQPATSLNLLTGKSVNRDSFIEQLLNEFFSNYDLFMKKGFEFIKGNYEKKCDFLGSNVAVKALNSVETGVAQKINIDGSLELLKDNNQTNTIFMGDLLC